MSGASVYIVLAFGGFEEIHYQKRIFHQESNSYQQAIYSNRQERLRAISKSLPFDKFSPRPFLKMLHYVTLWLTCFPDNDAKRKTISSRALLSAGYNTKAIYKHMKKVITHYRLENLRIAINCHDEANISEPTLRKRIYKYARTELPVRKSIITST